MSEFCAVMRSVPLLPRLLVFCVIFLDNQQVNPATELFLSSEDGRIHVEMDSLFAVRNPADVFAFLDQEQSITEMQELEEALGKMRSRLDELMNRDDDDVDIEKVILRNEPDCMRAGDLYKKLNLFESVVLSLEAKGFKTEEFITTSRTKISRSAAVPDCAQSVNGDSTVGLLGQLKGYQKGRGLQVAPEGDIIREVTAGLTPVEYGTSVSQAMKKNNTSWILFNMATFYYRIVGDANTAMECARRALHFSPREHRDIALLNMASLLFRGDYPRDALAMASMALDMSGETSAGYTLLGFMLASLSKFEEAVEAFGKAIRLSKRKNKLRDYQFAIKCHAKVHKGLSDQHKGLRDVIRQFEKIGETTRKIEYLMSSIHDAKRPSAGGLLGDYENGKGYSHTFQADGSYVITDLISPIEPPRWLSSVDLSDPSDPIKFGQVFIPETDYHFFATDWPTSEECALHVAKERLNFKTESVLILLEHKGFPFWSVVGPLHLPGHGFPLPYCEPYSAPQISELAAAMDEAFDSDDSVRYLDHGMIKVISDYLAECERLEVFGRKMSMAFILGILPSWMYYNMAAVYWRAIGATIRAAECLKRAYADVPPKFKDVVLINMATFFSFVNETEMSLAMVKEAVEVTALEPATLFTMGNVLGAHGFLSLAVKNYRLTLTQDVSFYPALEALRKTRCAQIAMGATEKSFSADKVLESLGNGVIEIGIFDTSTGLQIVSKRTTSDNSAKGESSDFSQKLHNLINDLKKPKKINKAK
ncbi:tetratricopeptide repeat protein 17-like [Paramacrobiotus metropolitanus]|uniref:tetratricopeptide repeat protein 17-like n=1 Tax=Paramacrobiotus metropolitanus TaxID=2943436 RepID=UPI00244658A2|nr:tetratricopeptide repeat protein 17-like [Paramacrobiotus metropolitanus]